MEKGSDMEIRNNELRKMQLLQVKILLEVKRICEKHDIHYFLCGGTLIGAIRHKGFIPWDDDIDIGMLREDFDKFRSVIQSEISGEYFWHSYNMYGMQVYLKNTKLKTARMARASYIGISIDILAFDKIPDNVFAAFFYCNFFYVLLRVYRFRMGFISKPKNILYRFIIHVSRLLFAPYSTKFIEIILNNYHKKYMNQDLKYRIPLTSGYGFFRTRNLYTMTSKLGTALFEGIKMPIPAGYHTLLTAQYGDYMKLPPVEKQIPRHDAVELDFGPYR
jgi:lipopolysaccharide cholinephosphotransferase